MASACGSSGGSSTSGTTAATAAGGGQAPAQALDAAYKGVTGTPPTTPTKAKPGVNLWVVSCGEQVPSCSTPVAAVEEAAKLVGWNVTKCDGQLNPGGWGTCIRQATSAKATAIVPVGIDCPSVKAPMQEAKAAGVKLIGGGGTDCAVGGSGDKVMDTERCSWRATTSSSTGTSTASCRRRRHPHRSAVRRRQRQRAHPRRRPGLGQPGVQRRRPARRRRPVHLPGAQARRARLTRHSFPAGEAPAARTSREKHR